MSEEYLEISFLDLLNTRIVKANSLLCIGLDPHSSQLPSFDAESAKSFCLNIIDKTHQYAAAYKPNAAFFEVFGADGISALIEVILAIPKDIPVILDVKRGDIETTAQAYADACYQHLRSHAVTLSPYMGWDSVSPFVTGKYKNKGTFLLCKTSNPSSKEIQELLLTSGLSVFEQIASMSSTWNSRNDNNTGTIGLVVGATDIPSLKRVRKIAPDLWFLCPGVGAQGGDAQSVCDAGLRVDGSGLLVSVSRGISSATDMTSAALNLRDDINACRATTLAKHKESHSAVAAAGGTSEIIPLKDYQRNFLEMSLHCGALRFGSFTLKSGRISPYFFNAGLFCSGDVLQSLGRYYAQAVHDANIEFDVIFGPAYKGIPLATALATAWSQLYGENKDVSYNRKEAKDHGEGGLLVGAPIRGRRVLIVDDVITAGTAIKESLAILQQFDANLAGVVVALDRQEWSGSKEDGSAIQCVEKAHGVPVVSIAKLKHLVTFVADGHAAGIGSEQLEQLRTYRETYGVDY